MRREVLLLTIFFFVLMFGASEAGAEDLKVAIVSQETAITAEDVDQISLTYSKLNKVILVKMAFNASGKSKLEGVLKSNLNKKLTLMMGNDIVLLPVHITTEEAFNPLTVSIDDEATAVKLLKNLSH